MVDSSPSHLPKAALLGLDFKRLGRDGHMLAALQTAKHDFPSVSDFVVTDHAPVLTVDRCQSTDCETRLHLLRFSSPKQGFKMEY